MQRNTPNSQYNIAAPESIPVKVTAYQRRRMFAKFLQELAPQAHDRVLDVGATSDQTYEASNYLEAWYAHKSKVTAMGIDDASFLEQKYPGMRFVNGNGLNMPFDDREFDIVHSSAVLEHVGSAENQLRFVSECARVANRAFFLTTPNRWFPIEFHTTLPLIHWLPKSVFRRILRLMKLDFFAEESNLNLMTSSELKTIAGQLNDFNIKVSWVRLGPFKSNLLIIGHRLTSKNSLAG
jgi:hypothetical protein